MVTDTAILAQVRRCQARFSMIPSSQYLLSKCDISHAQVSSSSAIRWSRSNVSQHLTNVMVVPSKMIFSSSGNKATILAHIDILAPAINTITTPIPRIRVGAPVRIMEMGTMA